MTWLIEERKKLNQSIADKMFVTRSLSELLKSPETLAAPPEGPNSGYLVIQDEESERYSCFGCCKRRSLKQLPFPQNKELTVTYLIPTGDKTEISLDPVLLIPVLNQPLSANLYYAIVPHGKRKGQAFTCSTDEDKVRCCFCRCTKDVKPRPLDPQNIYQQFKISPDEGFLSLKGAFFATSMASDGHPPYFVRRKGWSIYTKTPRNFKLGTAHGLDYKLRAHLPQLHSSAVRVVGKWYCPFVFIKEALTLKQQVKRSMYYEMTLEQRWERIFGCNNNGSSSVVINGFFDREEVFVGGGKATWDETNVVDGVIWFKDNNGRTSVGLRREIVERMKWEEARGGWNGNGGRQVKINKVEKFKGNGRWNEFGCYVLVERFSLKRMDGSLVLCYDFKHFHQMKTKWE